MKRIVICFDGTWNRIDAEEPTNVLMLSTGIAPASDENIKQVVHYDEGVGTSGGWLTKMIDGALGRGILRNLAEAYRFLMFNYDPEDEVYLFGFSRGAYTARSFVGLVRSVGIIQRDNVREVKRAIRLYKKGKPYDSLDMLNFRAKHSSHISTCGEDEAHRCSGLFDYTPGSSLPFKFRYVGLWDTVETIGLMKVIWATVSDRVGLPYVDKDHRYHDHKLNGMIVAGRHAVALDERRRHFHSEPWGDVAKLNQRLGFDEMEESRPIQECFFPGDHGSVGGGGDVRGLSDTAFEWVVEGAKEAGLGLDVSATSSIYTILPDYRDPLRNTTEAPRRFSIMGSLKNDRTHKPKGFHQIHESAQRRWAHGDRDNEQYRPVNLNDFAQELNKLNFPEPYETKILRGKMEAGNLQNRYTYHTVVRKETLRSIAEQYLETAGQWRKIYEINADIISDPDRIYVGQVIRVPKIDAHDPDD